MGSDVIRLQSTEKQKSRHHKPQVGRGSGLKNKSLTLPRVVYSTAISLKKKYT